MKISKFQIFQYDLPLQRPLNIGKKKLNSRQGILLRIENEDGIAGWGEASPLPGLSQETFEDVVKQAIKIKADLLNQVVPNHLEKLNGKFEKWLKEFHLAASVRFAVETAVLNMIAQKKHRQIRHVIPGASRDDILICGLLIGTKTAMVKEAKALIKRGYKVLKIKVGSKNTSEDIDKIRAVIHVSKDKALLRLDANRKWTLKDAIKFGNEIGIATIEYIEEPLKDISTIEKFFDATTIPVALDESLIQFGLKHIKSIQGIDIIVLKPTILGGIEKAWQLMTDAKDYGLEVIISSSFESGVGLMALAQLASCTKHDYAAGLDTLKWFKDDVTHQLVDINRGHIHLNRSLEIESHINHNMIEEIHNA